MTGMCRLCGGKITYNAKRFAWTHVAPGSDHGPVPS